MNNKTITFIIFLGILLLLFLLPKGERKNSSEETALIQKNYALANSNDSLKNLLKISNIARDNFRLENSKLIKLGNKKDSLYKLKEKELSFIKHKYDNISDDSLLILINKRIKPGTNINRWALEENDSVSILSSLLQAQTSIIDIKDKRIDLYINIIKTYKLDSAYNQQIIARKDTIIDNQNKIIDHKNERIRKATFKERVLEIGLVVMTIIAIAK